MISYVKKNTSEKRGRNWAFIVYPDSLPIDWLSILKQTGLKIAISPLHDSDINPDEQEKKAHYHIIACWNNTTTYNAAYEVSKSVGGTVPQLLNQIRGMYRYLTHKDNPEKFQYDEADIVCLNGFDIIDHIELTKSEVHIIKKDLIKLIEELDFLEYRRFIFHLVKDGTSEQFDVGSNNTIFFNNYISSRRNEFLQEQKRL